MVSLGVLGERVAEDTKYNGLINLQGLPHKNYAGDLYNEHINKMFKVVKIINVTILVHFHYQEFFGSEGVAQVYAQVTQWLFTLPEEKRRKISWILYDDMCHLGMWLIN